MQTDALKPLYTLPQIPHRIKALNECAILLTDREKDDWVFLFEELPDIPSAFSENQDYDFDSLPKKAFKKVTVPSSLVMQGFDIKNNTEYYYKRTVSIPKGFHNNNVFLRFEGVYSSARVWVNNKFVGRHTGGFTPWDVDISSFSKCESITLIIGVTDIEGDKKSPWGNKGEYKSDAAWASYYAHFNVCGIIRDITLFCLPKKAVIRTHINTFLKGAVSTADLSLALTDSAIGCSLKAQIFSGDSLKAEKEITVTKTNEKLSLDVSFAELWTAETPSLYTLCITLLSDNEPLQENRVKFGFREITYGGKNGTEKNKVYVNGSEIKLRGVCRHDVSRLYGRSLTKDDIYNEIKTFKEHNINHIRTSHYPVSDYMLSVCDELGMYVEQENAACFKGANGYGVYCEPQDFLRSFAEMIEFSRNHPSVIIWSIANESGFEESKGFRDCYNYIKKTDVSRPVIFSYPFTVKSKPLPYDIFSKHYEKVTSNLGKKSMPILHDEFAHVSCYNIEDISTDNSLRDFWGESIKLGWDSIFNTPGALGCDIWGSIDDVFYLPEKSYEKHQCHLTGSCAGYGEWGCIFDAFKRLKPEAYLTKKAFSPVHITETTVFGDEIRFKIQNRFDHTNLNELEVKVLDSKSREIYRKKIKESVLPHETGTVSLLPLGVCKNMTVSFIFERIEVETVTVLPVTEELKINASSYACEYKENGVFIKANNRPMAFLRAASYLGAVCTLKKQHDNSYKADFHEKSFKITIRENGDKIDFDVVDGIASKTPVKGEVSLLFAICGEVSSVSWNKNALYDFYPQNHIGRISGTAKKKGLKHAYRDTELLGVSWEQDMSAYAFFADGRLENRLASNDFRTKRLSIKEYLLNVDSGEKLLVKTDSSDINAYMNPFSSELQIGCGSFWPSLSWGNYFGKKNKLASGFKFGFSMSFGK